MKRIAQSLKILLILFILLLFFSLPGLPSANITTYIVPAISDAKILPSSPISSSYLGTNLSTQVCPGEITSLSFIIDSDRQIDNLTISSSDLSGSCGTIPNCAIDIKTVKCLYKGNYVSTSGKSVGKYLVNQMLLHDDSLINVTGDYWTKPSVSNPDGYNYLKLTNGTYINISSTEQHGGMYIIPISDRLIQDANTLQPLNLSANYNKQIWVTLYVPSNATAGTYSGTINLTKESSQDNLSKFSIECIDFHDRNPQSKLQRMINYIGYFATGPNDTQTLKTLNISIVVLPFSLAPAKIEGSVYYRGFIDDNGSISSENKTVAQYTAEHLDMMQHGITNPTMYPWVNNTTFLQQLYIRQQVGMNNTNLYHVVATGSTADSNWITAYQYLASSYGVQKIFEYGPDERDLNQPSILAQIEDIHSVGGGFFDAQYNDYTASSVANVLDLVVFLYLSPDIEDLYHSYNHRIFSYANPFTPADYPRLFRMNYGLKLWQNNYDGAMDYAYQASNYDIWNDFDQGDRDHCLTYPTQNGVIDTLKWEGFREGTNDLRFLATLQDAIDQDPTNTTSIEAQNYLDTLKTEDLTYQDLDIIRTQMIDYIITINPNSHKLTVEQGSNSGYYEFGSIIPLTANIPQAGMVFNGWSGDTQYLSNVSSTNPTLTMPNQPVNVSATYTINLSN